jgi:methionyl-tRNA synthetase
MDFIINMATIFPGTNIPVWVVVPLIVWDAVWKGIALWKSGRNNQLVWFIAILIANTVGILPIVYLLFFQKKLKK